MPQIHIGIGELMVSNNADDSFKTTVGSCVGVALFDKKRKVAGLAHIMLPKSNDANSKSGKYADTAIKEVLNIMIFRYGASRDNIVAKIVGGGEMFANLKSENSCMHIGEKNVEAVKELLREKKIRIVGSDVGKNYGRTLIFYVETGKLVVSKPSDGTIEL